MKFKNNLFIKNVATLMAGTAIGQIVSIVLTPLITRLYAPADLGLLDLFVSIIAILTSITSLKYDQAIVIANNDKDSFRLTKLTIIINGIICLALFLIVLLFSEKISIWFNNKSIRYYLFLIPVVIFFSSFFSASRSLAIRLKNFKIISQALVYKSLLSSLAQIFFGFLKLGAIGLISGPVFSSIFINKTIYNKVTKKFANSNFHFWKRTEKKRYLVLLKKYKDFPKYSVAGSLANTLVLSGTSIFICKMFSVVELGYLALAQRVLSIPLNLISAAVGDVFFQQVTEEKFKFGNAKKRFMSTFKFLSIIAVIGVALVYFVLPDLFGFIFGSKWEKAGYYSSILVFLYGIRFINTPLSTTFIVFEKQKELLFWTLFQLVVLIATILFTVNLEYNFNQFIILNVVSQSVFYLFFLYRSYSVSLNLNSSL